MNNVSKMYERCEQVLVDCIQQSAHVADHILPGHSLLCAEITSDSHHLLVGQVAGTDLNANGNTLQKSYNKIFL